jgi:AcrR family transcriptional regulator
MPGGERARRADAERNRRLVVAAGLEALRRDPTMSMQEIADASGLGRTTLYRHFSSREMLVEAVFEAAGEDARARTASVLEEQAGPEEALRAISGAVFELTARYRRLISSREMGEAAVEASRDARSPVGNFLREARRDGSIRSDLPLSWQLSTLQTLASEAVDEIEDGVLRRPEAERLLADTVVSILIPRADQQV